MVASGPGWPPDGFPARAYGITDELGTDQVLRMREIMRLNPGLMITTPRQNGMGRFCADWTAEDETVGRATHHELRTLLDKLTDVYGFEDA